MDIENNRSLERYLYGNKAIFILLIAGIRNDCYCGNFGLRSEDSEYFCSLKIILIILKK